MGVRIYMKSGNNYYIDIIGFDMEVILDSICDAISLKDILTIDGVKCVSINAKEIEYFEVELDEAYTNDEPETPNTIGFKGGV